MLTDMQNRKTKRNTPIATLVKNYMDKKSGKVSVSRDEIKWRFNCLDWKYQKKILDAFLTAGASDREWAYTKLLDFWDNSFEPKVKELWEIYHEYRCSWVVIRYFPLDYIKEHLTEFTDERDYYFISLRFAKNEGYVIDRSKLSTTDYLALLYHTGRSISSTDALDALFNIVRDCCLENSYLIRLERVGKGKYRNVITPMNYRKVDLAFYYILQLQQYDALLLFKRWNEELEETIYNSPEFKAINRNDIDNDYEYDFRRIEVANLYAYRALDDKYKF